MNNKLIIGGIVGVALLSGYALMKNDDSDKSSYVRTDNPQQARSVLSTGAKDKDCTDFSSHREAQEFFETNGGPSSDLHNLDRDGDGRACETLP